LALRRFWQLHLPSYLRPPMRVREGMAEAAVVSRAAVVVVVLPFEVAAAVVFAAAASLLVRASAAVHAPEASLAVPLSGPARLQHARPSPGVRSPSSAAITETVTGEGETGAAMV
jgi:hypothetical protein